MVLASSTTPICSLRVHTTEYPLFLPSSKKGLELVIVTLYISQALFDGQRLYQWCYNEIVITFKCSASKVQNAHC